MGQLGWLEQGKSGLVGMDCGPSDCDRSRSYGEKLNINHFLEDGGARGWWDRKGMCNHAIIFPHQFFYLLWLFFYVFCFCGIMNFRISIIKKLITSKIYIYI